LKEKQDYQIILNVESNLKLYLDELDLFYKKYLNEQIKKLFFNKNKIYLLLQLLFW